MGGMPIVAIGYEVTDARSLHQLDTQPGVQSFKKLLRDLESKISTPIALARLEDSGGLSRMFLCCYVDYASKVYDCEELKAMTVPPQFTRVKELLHIDGDLKRVFAHQGIIFSYDSNGETRVKERG